MDLTSWLLRQSLPRPLVVAMPGGTGTRLAAERVIRERSWREAASPAEANILVVAGPVSNDMQPYVDAVWAQVPAPRAQANIASATTATSALDAAAAALRDADHQRGQAAHTATGHCDHAGHDHGDPGSDEAGEHPEQDQHDHSHNGHDMGGMEMPGGVAMADRGEDRDGLMLDQLHVPLGPVLPDWPAGLIVRTTLQGDVTQQAWAEITGFGGVRAVPFWSRPGSAQWVAARKLDSCARLLSVTGWVDAAAAARRIRDAALGAGRREEINGSLSLWARRVRRSRTLRWSLAGIGAAPDEPSTPPQLRGDAWARLHRWVDTAVRCLAEGGTGESDVDEAQEARWTVDALPALLDGTEFATARLLVASLDPDLETLAARELAHG